MKGMTEHKATTDNQTQMKQEQDQRA